MRTADATLLPAIGDGLDDRDSSRTLDEIGVGAVLNAMIEQRKRSSRPPVDEIEAIEIDDVDAIAEAPRSRRAPANSEAFLKAR
jgi:hypothetical protein